MRYERCVCQKLLVQNLFVSVLKVIKIFIRNLTVCVVFLMCENVYRKWNRKVKRCGSEEEEFIRDFLFRNRFEILTSQVGQFVRVLTGSRDTSSSRPVVVQESLLVSQSLNLIRIQSFLVLHNDVMCRSHCSLSDML